MMATLCSKTRHIHQKHFYPILVQKLNKHKILTKNNKINNKNNNNKIMVIKPMFINTMIKK